MPTSNDTRVLVEGFWKIMPSVRPDRRGVSSPAARDAFSSSARSRAVSHSSADQSETRVKLLPWSPSATAITGQSYRLIRLISID